MDRDTQVDTVAPGQRWRAATVEVDAREFPLTVVRYRGAVSDEDFDRHVTVMSSLLRHELRTVVVLDTTEGNAKSAKSLRCLQQWMQQEAGALERQTIALVMVMPNAATRFLLSSFLLAVDMPCPYKVVDSFAAACAFARSRLALAS
jgi:hypothetical protein